VPERLNVGLAFDDDDMTSVSCIAETVQPVELWLRAGLPTKTVALRCNSEADGQKLAADAEIGNANSRSVLIG